MVNRRARAQTGKYTTDAYRRAARQAKFGSPEEAKFLQRQAEGVPRVDRRFDGGWASPEERAEDDVWTRVANAKRNDEKDKVVDNVSREAFKNDAQREAYNRLTDRVRAASAEQTKYDAERDKKDPEARKRFDASITSSIYKPQVIR